MGAVTVGAVGTTVTSGAAASSAAAIPNDASGNRARFVRVTATTLAHIKFGGASVAATADDALVSTTPTVFKVAGFTHFSVIEQTAASKVNIVPCDDERL